MAKHQKKFNTIRLIEGARIGSAAAETDEAFLFDCFVKYPAFLRCANLDDPGMIILGRTGAGKTGIIRYIADQYDYTREINPSDMAMSYVSNSDALNFLSAIGADLDLLFQVLWKHVLCIEFIRLRWGVDTEEKSRNIFARISEHFQRDQRKKKAIEYLKAWEGKFWITMDENIKELTQKVEEALKIEMGAEIEKFKVGGQYDKRLSVEKKSELVARARKIIDASQLQDLNKVIEILAEDAAEERMHQCYLMIDRLDEKWVDTSIRFKLIRALIESLKTFRRIRQLKILVALRVDILERVVQETRDLTYQREKIAEYFVTMKWSYEHLKELAERRVKTMFRKQYSAEGVSFDEIFTSSVAGQDPFAYMLSRTLMRPRDIIAFINQCLADSEGKTTISADQIRKSEVEYSRQRREALEQEWESAFPSLNAIIDSLASLRKPVVSVADFADKTIIDDLVLRLYNYDSKEFDPIVKARNEYFSANDPNQIELAKQIFSILYRVGVVGIKVQPGDKYLYSHNDAPLIAASSLGATSKAKFHEMLYGTLRMKEKNYNMQGV